MKKRIFYIGGVLLVIGVFLTIVSTWNLNYESYKVSDGEETIDARIYEGGETAVVLVHGFSSDKAYNYRLANILQRNGFTVVLFDSQGHGQSTGTIGFDNAQTEDLVSNLEAVVTDLEVKGFATEDIILIGHSMGARTIMQYATYGDTFKDIVLVGPEINLLPNTQSSFFTGANDLEMPFVSRMSKSSPMSDVLIITSTWDDISPVESNEELLSVLNSGTSSYTREIVVVNRVLHNYELFSPQVINQIIEYIEPSGSGYIFQYVYLWIIGLLFILASPIVMFKSFKQKSVLQLKELDRKFFKTRLLMWLLSIVALILLVGITFILPIRKPFFSVQFVYIVGGYGLVSLLLFRKKQKFSLSKELKDIQSIKVIKPILFGLVFVIVSSIVRYSGFNIIFRNIDMFIWYILFVILMTIGFYVLAKDSNYVNLTATKRQKIYWNIIKYFPFYIFAIVYILLGSLSGITTSVQGLLFLAYGVYVSKLVNIKADNDLVSSFILALIIAVPFGSLF